ncbi:MAG: phosphoenolpyruvate hydrolase family protein [Moorellaceae bacterium]
MIIMRQDIRDLLMTNIKKRKPIIGVAVGSGLAAKQAAEGGADFLLVLSAGRFRSAGVPSIACMLPFCNSNQLVMDFGTREILPRVTDKPVIFGFCATDPTIHQDILLDSIISRGFHGVNNFPTVGLIDGIFRQAMEENGMGFEQEIEFMRKAVTKGLFTVAFVFNEDQSIRMARVGVDVICAHLGWTVGGENSVKQRISLEEGARIAERIFAAASRINPEAIRMVYGGPIKEPEDAEFFFRHTTAMGYIGGSSFERIPTETVIKQTTHSFKNYAYILRENEMLKKELLRKKRFDEIVGQSRAMQELYDIISRVADKNINVLVVGESGTGKELVVRAIHYNSPRSNNPFIKVNCAALPESILESELFGHEKGSFTGASYKKIGLFELADKGTLFLDEIAEMSPKTQAKLLRAIQDQEFFRVGGSQAVKVDVRIICATNVDIRKAVAEGRFREDLYYRISVVTINTPPLREHKEDIPLLVNHFLREINEKFGLRIRRLTPAALDCFMRYDWPGNVRELEHVLERAAVLAEGEVIGLNELPAYIRNAGSSCEEEGIHGQAIRKASENLLTLERELIRDALEKFSWNQTKASQYLGISRRTLYNKIKRYGLRQKERA